jgi:hypothetical protein
MASLSELEAERAPTQRRLAGFLPIPERFVGEHPSELTDPRIQVIGSMHQDVRQTLVPSPKVSIYKCYIHHSAISCNCGAIEIKRPDMLEVAGTSIMYTLAALKNEPKGSLKRPDLDFLAYSVGKIAAHWARLALGQEDLL